MHGSECAARIRKICRGPSISSPVHHARPTSNSTSSSVRTDLAVSILCSSKTTRCQWVKTARNTARPRDDRRLWQEAVRDVEPLQVRRPPTAPAAIPGSGPRPAGGSNPRAGQPAQTVPLDRLAGIDRATAERLKRGLHKVQATLDLHGMTQAEAHRALGVFVAASHDAGRRCVLVITGRGLGPRGPGILKSSLPRWLEEPALRRLILAITPAQPRHGGAGASYLLLRRSR